MDIANPGFVGGFMIIYMIFMLGLCGISIYCFILFIKLARRGIKALDIYIDKNDI